MLNKINKYRNSRQTKKHHKEIFIEERDCQIRDLMTDDSLSLIDKLDKVEAIEREYKDINDRLIRRTLRYLKQLYRRQLRAELEATA